MRSSVKRNIKPTVADRPVPVPVPVPVHVLIVIVVTGYWVQTDPNLYMRNQNFGCIAPVRFENP